MGEWVEDPLAPNGWRYEESQYTNIEEQDDLTHLDHMATNTTKVFDFDGQLTQPPQDPHLRIKSHVDEFGRSV